jgi:glutathione reductase (NADPH)
LSDFDLFVIGAGSGGVRAARIAAAHGARVAVAEEHKVGGTCVIRGCVPKKLLVYGAHFAEDLNDAAMYGWDVPKCAFNWPVLRDNVLAEVGRLEGLYTQTLSNHKVEIFHERATLTGPNEVRLASGRTITAGKILIATGARPHMPQEVEGIEHAISSNEVFHLENLPKRIVIAGGGYIANEFAGIFHQFGSHVIVVNRSDVILRGYDEQMRDRLLQISMTKGIEYRFNSSFNRIEKRRDGGLFVDMEGCDDIEADAVLFATGRVPNVEGLGLEDVDVALGDRGQIKVDASSRTNVPSIFAVGDVTDRIQLTPVAIREGHAFADSEFGGEPWTVNYDCVPHAVFSHPPIASVGLTEGEARNKLGQVRTFTSDFRAMKNVLAGRNERSLYKLVVDGATDQVVGIHMIGPDAPEILQAAAVAVKAGLKKSDFDQTVALHPTMSEELVLMR